MGTSLPIESMTKRSSGVGAKRPKVSILSEQAMGDSRDWRRRTIAVKSGDAGEDSMFASSIDGWVSGRRKDVRARNGVRTMALSAFVSSAPFGEVSF
jgi:hypothetical protein